jgi:3' exoribonuclease, RNase T-like
MTHLMLDLETLGTAPGSVVLSIGARAFDPLEGKMLAPFYVNLARDQQDEAGLKASASTMEWWEKQSDEAKAHLRTPSPRHPLTALHMLHTFYRTHKCGEVWGHGATFDVSLIEAVFNTFRLPVPWRFSSVRDTRTLFALSGTEVQRGKGTHHYALDDATRQAEAVCEAYHALGMTRHPWSQHLMMALRRRRTGEFYDWLRP